MHPLHSHRAVDRPSDVPWLLHFVNRPHNKKNEGIDLGIETMFWLLSSWLALHSTFIEALPSADASKSLLRLGCVESLLILDGSSDLDENVDQSKPTKLMLGEELSGDHLLTVR
eukprot:CCRYP_014233-RA/>CCRYP_014233-RA protein AED:0.10 eAED:0.10 QI:102/0/0.5/1/0/0/2/472/113